MPFDTGPISCYICHLPQPLPDNVLQRFQEHTGSSLSTLEAEPEIAWVTGRHLLDTRIDEQTAYAGGYLHLQLRTAQRRIPASLFKAECRIQELTFMQANNTTFVGRKQKKVIKEEVEARLIKQMPPTLSGVPFVADPANEVMFVGVGSPSQFDTFATAFATTVGFEPIPLRPADAAALIFNEDPARLRHLHFSPQQPPVSGGEQSLGRDFCTWLWYFQECQEGVFKVADTGEFAISIDGPLTFAAEDSAAMESVVRKGLPTRSAEAKAALLVGKKLRLAKFFLARDRQVWTFTLDAENFGFRALKLPEGEELEPHSHFQERVMFLNTFRRAFLALFELYLEQLTDDAKYERLQPAIYEWVNHLEGQ